MPGVLRLYTVLVRLLRISNREAEQLIGEGRVLVNGKHVPPATKLEYWDEVSFDGKIIREGKQFTYLLLNKPVGIESTMNREIPGNLCTIVDHPEKLHPVGRLDKNSEGLMILTDDGRLFTSIARSDKHVEKEYLVTVDRAVDESFLQQMREGVVIMGQLTRPAQAWAETADINSFRIILTQGLNRQIRRMCYKLGYEVVKLKRVRIADIELGELEPGKFVELKDVEWSKFYR